MSISASEISHLASILHENGDKVLNAISKLSLNAVLLQKLNQEFEALLENATDNEESFNVLTPIHGNSQLLQDLYFLHDFIQKTVGLKLSNNSNLNLSNNTINVSKFKNIKYLEIRKIPILQIVGLKTVQSQLESIICMRSLSNLEDFFSKCGGDNSNHLIWSQLIEAVFSYNNIKVIDTSIALAPWLQVLDLSHNQINDVKAIECLPNLKYVNLSFNCLDVIPTFNKSARKKIEILVMKNNYIEDLFGLDELSHLIELDMSNNWIANWESLNTLLTISTLQWLSFNGNPISCHSYYRKIVAGYLHISASLSDFYLDKIKLSKKEKTIVGIKLYDGNVLHNKSVNSVTTDSFQKNSRMSVGKTNESVSSSRKSGKARVVVIPNLDDGTYEEIPTYTNNLDVLSNSSSEYLITKKRIENTRLTYGIDNWLVHGSSVVQDILGLPPAKVSTSTPCDDLFLKAALDSVKNVVTTVAVIESQPHALKENEKLTGDSFVTCLEGDSSNYYSAETSIEKSESNATNKQEIKELKSSKKSSAETQEIKKEKKDDDNNNEKVNEENHDDEDDDDDDGNGDEDNMEIDENENLFVVVKESTKFNGEIIQEEIFLTVTESELLERETTKGKINMKWCLSSLESCVKLKPDKLQLVFDTVRRDKKERIYTLEEEEANVLYKKLVEILESRTLSDMNQVAYKCENCGSHFSVETKCRKSGLRRSSNQFCPFCHSKFILVLDESPLPLSDKKVFEVKNSKNKNLKISHNRSSSASGFFQNFLSHNDDRLLKCASHSSIGSATSLDESRDVPRNQNSNVKKSDSDIEILSNPSQSSIEVIDNPGSKRSSEERQDVLSASTVVASNLVKNNIPMGLTESSSSGSVTDSICTAYESSANAVASKVESEKELNKKPEEPKEQTEPILQDVLNSIRKKIKNSKKIDAVNYSYADFTNIDHRIKLYLYTHVFEDAAEEFSFGIRAVVSMVNAQNSSHSSFPACVIASTKNLYFLKVVNPEQGDDARDFLQKVDSLCFSLNSILSISLLTWEQGFGLNIKTPKNKLNYYLILIMDSIRTRNFLKFLTSSDILGAGNIEIIKETEQKPYWSLQHLLLSSPSLDDSNIQHFGLVNSCSITTETNSKVVNFPGFLTNSTEILLLGGNSSWLHEEANQEPKIEAFQKFKNLVQVYSNKSVIVLQFFDAVKEAEVWSLFVESENSCDEFLKYIKQSWEKIFSISLQVLPI